MPLMLAATAGAVRKAHAQGTIASSKVSMQPSAAKLLQLPRAALASHAILSSICPA
jgi:hypothetical protein